MKDDIIYGSLLIFGIIIGPYIQKIKNAKVRQKTSAAAGFVFAVCASGWDVLHPLALILVNAFLVTFSSKRICHVLSFSFCFAYLILVRVGYYVGLASPPIYGSAIQMYVTLKMVGLAFEVHDANMPQEFVKYPIKTRMLAMHPSFIDILCYGFCHAGILTGPYFKFQTYIDSFQDSVQYHKDIFLPHLINRLKLVPLFLIIFIILRSEFPPQHVISDEILQGSFWFRVWYIVPVTFAYRLRLVILFRLSEGQCITMAIGRYHHKCLSKPGNGPTVFQHLENENRKENSAMSTSSSYDFETIHSVNVAKCELAVTTNEFATNWNMTVQYWLYWFVYRRLPIDKSYRAAATGFISALWHGIEPAYFIWIGTMIMTIFTQNVMSNAFHKNSNKFSQLMFNCFCWIISYTMFSYSSITFLLVDTWSLLTYYRSVHFFGHFLLALVNIIFINIRVKSS